MTYDYDRVAVRDTQENRDFALKVRRLTPKADLLERLSTLLTELWGYGTQGTAGDNIAKDLYGYVREFPEWDHGPDNLEEFLEGHVLDDIEKYLKDSLAVIRRLKS